MKERKYPCYGIYVKNFIVFYEVIPDESDSNIGCLRTTQCDSEPLRKFFLRGF